MNLKYLKIDACPLCGSTTVIKEIIYTSNGEVRTHSNGERWEYRQFLCGQEVCYVPNFRDIELSKYNVCTENEEYKNKQIKRENNKRELLKYIESLDVDDGVKKAWKDSIY